MAGLSGRKADSGGVAGASLEEPPAGAVSQVTTAEETSSKRQLRLRQLFGRPGFVLLEWIETVEGARGDLHTFDHRDVQPRMTFMHQWQVRATGDYAVQRGHDLDRALAHPVGDDREALSGSNLRTRRLVGLQHAAMVPAPSDSSGELTVGETSLAFLSGRNISSRCITFMTPLMPLPHEGLVLGGGAVFRLLEEAAGQAGPDLVELESQVLAPEKELAQRSGVGGPGMRVRESGRDELIDRKAGGMSGEQEDRPDFCFGVRFGQQIQVSEGEIPLSHHRI